MTKEELEKENAELQEENGKLLQRIIQLEKDVTENESDCSMCDCAQERYACGCLTHAYVS